MRLIDADALLWELKNDAYPQDASFGRGRECVMDAIRNAPTIEPKTNVIAQVTFDEDKLREIVHEAVERIKTDDCQTR